MVLTNNYQVLKTEYLFNSGYGIGYEYLDARISSVDTINNITYVQLRQRVAGGSWYSTNCSSTIDGSTVAIPGTVYNSYTRERTVPVPHEEDGTAINIVKTAYFYSLWNDAGKGAISGTFDLPAIPRQSILNILGTDITIGAAGPETYIVTSITDYVEGSYKEYAIKVGSTIIRDFTDEFDGLGDMIIFSLAELDDILTLIPNTNQVTLTFILKTYTNSSKTTQIGVDNIVQKIGTLNGSYGYPIFDTYSLVDNNATTLALGDYIKLQSELKVTILTANKAIGQYGATIQSYELQIGEDTPNVFDYESSTNAVFTLPKALFTNGLVKVSAIDSRNIKTTVQTNITVLDYAVPEINFLQLDRKDGAGEVVYLTNTNKITPVEFTNGDNKIKYFGYRVKLDSEEWDAQIWYDITEDYNLTAIAATGEFAGYYFINEDDLFEIFSNGVDATFTIGQKYNVQFKIKDGITGTVFNENIDTANVADGSLYLTHFKDEDNEYHIGYNTLPKEEYNHTFKGSMVQTLDGETFTPIGGGGGDSISIGTIKLWYSNTIEDGWLLCDGSTFDQAIYPELYAFLDNSNVLPNLKGRVPVGRDVAQTEFDTLGETGGHKLLQAHTHPVYETPADGVINWIEGVQRFKYDVAPIAQANTYVGNTGSNGGGNAQNLQPYAVVNYVIKAKIVQGVLPQDANVIDTLDSTSDSDSLSANMGKVLKDEIISRTNLPVFRGIYNLMGNEVRTFTTTSYVTLFTVYALKNMLMVMYPEVAGYTRTYTLVATVCNSFSGTSYLSIAGTQVMEFGIWGTSATTAGITKFEDITNFVKNILTDGNKDIQGKIVLLVQL